LASIVCDKANTLDDHIGDEHAFACFHPIDHGVSFALVGQCRGHFHPAGCWFLGRFEFNHGMLAWSKFIGVSANNKSGKEFDRLLFLRG